MKNQYMGKTLLILIILLFGVPLSIFEIMQYRSTGVNYFERISISGCEDEFKQHLGVGYVLIHSTTSTKKDGKIETQAGVGGRYNTKRLIHDMNCNIYEVKEEEGDYFIDLDDMTGKGDG